MQVPILSGTFASNDADFRTSYPRNLIPTPKENGISKGYLRPAEGVLPFAVGSGLDRGGINWRGICYRVSGSKLISIDASGNVTVIGDIGNDSNYVTFDYSFDRLGIASSGFLFYYDGSTLTRVTDVDLGTVLSFIWVDGYFMTTDGVNLVVTELTDPTQVNPLKYGSSEADPDPIVGIVKLRGEPYAINRNTIEAFSNVGGNLFPFQRVNGATISRGAIGPKAFCLFDEAIAFLGSGRNEALAIWVGVNGTSSRISSREIEIILKQYTEAQLASVVLETRIDNAHEHLFVHLPDQTLVFDAAASKISGFYVWFTVDSGLLTPTTYRAKGAVRCYDTWIVGDPTSNAIGVLTSAVSSHFGSVIGWSFGTTIIYNATNGAIFHELELVCLTGRVEPNSSPVVWTSYSTDGETWGQEIPRSAGKQGKRSQRINWLQQGNMLNFRIQKFRGTSEAHISIACLECRLEALNV